jgi:serine/threonine-protein kinase
VSDAGRIGVQVAGALAAAHATGMVHRDVKPANIVHADAETVKVVDFGVVRMLEETTDSFSLTETHSVIGTAAYLSPEQASGGAVDARSDLYGLGCVLFTLLTNQAPFTGESAVAVLSQHLHATPPSLLSLRPDTPPMLARLVEELLSKDPSARPASAADVVRRLAAISTGEPTVLLPASTALLPGGDVTAVLPDDTAVLASHRRSRLALLAAGLAVLVVAAVAIAIALSGDGKPAADRTAGPRHSPTPSATTSSPRPSASPTPTHTRPPLSTPALAIAAFRAGLDRALATGDIDDKGAEDLAHRLDDLENTIADAKKPEDTAHKVADLAKHVDDLASKSQLTASGRQALDRPLVALQRLFPSTD